MIVSLVIIYLISAILLKSIFALTFNVVPQVKDEIKETLTNSGINLEVDTFVNIAALVPVLNTYVLVVGVFRTITGSRKNRNK